MFDMLRDVPERARRVTVRAARFASLAALSLGGACDAGERLRALRERETTPHDRYAEALESAGLRETGLGRDWLVASDSVLRAPLGVTLPFQETGLFRRSEARALGYRLSLAEGQRVIVRVSVEGNPLALFVDLFEVTGDSARPFAHRAAAEPRGDVDTTVGSGGAERAAAQSFTLEHEARDGGTFILRIQPELLRDGRYRVEGRVAPILAFPVDGRGNGAVQSFFGADRDAGRRVHQGIDIFAPRGTAVLAATDGIVRSVSPNALGGNVVWLNDPVRGQVLYYAHLDRHAVAAGVSVRRGDTLGYVGNTGNARTTAPHLHFGIYRRGEGAIDPWPWVRRIVDRPATIVADTTRIGTIARPSRGRTPLRLEASVRGDTVRLVSRETPLQIVGAAGSWYRVELPDGVAGYLPSRLTSRGAEEPGRLGESPRRAGDPSSEPWR